jgi:hypothetical protein
MYDVSYTNAVPKSTSPDDHALSRLLLARKRELARLARDLHNAEYKVALLRDQRDARLRAWHEEGMSAQKLADAAGLTRQGVYDAIERYRRQLVELGIEDEPRSSGKEVRDG